MIDQIKEYIQHQVDIEVNKRVEELNVCKDKYQFLLQAIMRQVRDEHNNIKNTDDLSVTRYIHEQLMYGFVDVLNDSWSNFKKDLPKEDFEFITNNCTLKKKEE